MARQLGLPLAFAALSLLTTTRPCPAQASAEAGPAQNVAFPGAATLAGAVVDPTPLHWWTSDGNNATEDYLLKWLSGAVTAVGPMLDAQGGHWGYPTDLVEIGGVVHGVDATRRQLYTLNTTTGLVTPIGAQFSTNWANVHGLAYDAAGARLFAIDLVRKQILRINPANGVVTTVGAATLAGLTGLRSLAYRASDDRLYAVDFASGQLLKVHPTTGAITQAIAMAPNPGARIEELEFFGGQLYAMNGLLTAGNLSAGQLLQVDFTNGALTALGGVLNDCSPHSLVVKGIPETHQWSQAFGPGVANFVAPNSLNTQVSFSSPGVYGLRLTVFTLSGAVDDVVEITADACPNDPAKFAPGVCGCGVSDADSDSDGLADCLDGCPSDPAKIAPGVCGCGVAEFDTDGDGTFDCLDGCPNDPLKTAPGACGCSVADADTDGDGALDCQELCPNDPLKIEPGACGCGVADADSDGDGALNCLENCPNDPLKLEPGICGCGVSDIDGDGDKLADCVDGCPKDPLKSEPGACGCGQPETDSDGDATPDCVDGCPQDPDKIAPGACGCGAPDTDSDGDGAADCVDACAADPLKIGPGVCGCGVADADTDGDGTLNCLESCPDDPLKLEPGVCGCGAADVDSDGDGVLNCLESCPNDPLKLDPGLCGCGVADVDNDGDSVVECLDNCPALSNPTQDDLDSDGVGDACDNCPAHANSEQLDCDGDLVGDKCEIELGAELDLNLNGIPDNCEGANGTAYCFGDGSGAICPCSNPSLPGRGCANSTGLGSRLENFGGVSWTLDDAVLATSDLPLNRPALLFMGTEKKAGGAGAPFGAGLRCVSGQLKRFGVQNSGLTGSTERSGFVALSNGLITSGSTWYFQTWHRDSLVGCDKQFNLSNGFWMTFTP